MQLFWCDPMILLTCSGICVFPSLSARNPQPHTLSAKTALTKGHWTHTPSRWDTVHSHTESVFLSGVLCPLHCTPACPCGLVHT